MNSVKYSGESRWIAIRARLVNLEDRGPEIQIAVQDHGIGIARSEMPHIFEPFYRSAAVIDAQIHGAGLGLSLAKNIAEAMGGKLSVVSELARGSTFTLHLPVAQSQEFEVTGAAFDAAPTNTK
jgi:two-component system phosphate regulon sensor histidine kinase PhoR